ncbi:MAG TPA: ATP-binding cassette domain-containing protein [Ohtaekwangia sp.]
MIELKSVSVVRSGVLLFENLNWKINAGEHWLITGGNGSGKTVLLELLAGNLHATHGKIHYDFIQGDSWDQRFTERRALIHYIPTHAIQTFLKQYELFYQQRYYSIGDDRIPLVKEIFGTDIDPLHRMDFLPSFTIDSLLNLPVTRLSNGQLKKVLILKNLVQQLPRILLLDYPFEGLDHQSRQDLADFLNHLARSFSIQLFIADQDHHLPQVMNRKLVLHKLNIQSNEAFQSKTTQQPSIKNKPVHRVTDSPVVEMKEVTIRYGDVEIISRINWTIHKGERWALTGSNGSGKTTLFSLIFADHPLAYSEQVYLFGKRRGTGESIWDIKRRINYLGPELINYLNAASHGISGMEYILQQNKDVTPERIQAVIHFFQADSFLQQAVRRMSSGQLQLMLIISSLLSDKELLLLDEPFQFLDHEQKNRVQEYIQSHLHVDTTLVLITHYEQDILRWTDQRLHL